ncbi:MAG TPA: hypothetical protein QGF08_03050 [Candidatus Marinimicrobia bacterium]|jgi:hypothetical protein|nr:hypothetical protein [Candidatus Neomarinimicrobiota bacterium]MDP7436899.1 hypothetical protein [Candidatus Neomarinimicrobiota bacterium]HJL74648.1 hypothetical protein [Candidatus Neomarinimicrobiota bacterium]HJM69842.1 hypothetical protein [Candidatus Neomarinimicrobiota bacterium]|tara:strand:- start:1161 stop:1298 length:138 start_codon:yes stop_codon:yes gene_type:complete
MPNRGKDRRHDERRQDKMPVNEEKRKGEERRSDSERRHGEDRRQN